jgi:hypothetical protein
MIDQGRLVPSFLSHLETIICTGLIFTVRKYSRYCSHGLVVPQEKNAFLLPILASDMLVEMAAAIYGCFLCVIRYDVPGTA